MKRSCMSYLKKWLTLPDRKPLVIRGARQVGKTWLVRHFAESTGMRLVEFNFEKRSGKEVVPLFESDDPHEIIQSIERQLTIKIDPQNTLLFLDEIQAEPHLFAKLRWFYEDMPELPVVAAGSLLEFVLGTDRMRVPVGCINYMYMEPLSFIEFLLAMDQEQLVEVIRSFSWEKGISSAAHDQLMRFFKQYTYIGGMPKVVNSWAESKSLELVNMERQHILKTYMSDFGKYGSKVSRDLLANVVDVVPKSLGKQLVYTSIDPSEDKPQVMQALSWLNQARIVHTVNATAANGLPLKAEINTKFVKAILLDSGLCEASLDLTLSELEDVEEITMVNKGGIAEQMVGQLLRTIVPYYIEPALYYWLSLKKGSDAEIDYIIQHKRIIVPIEVKAGNTGSLRSLHSFMKLKKLSTAVRICSGVPGVSTIKAETENGPVEYELRSIPFYLISDLLRLLG